MEGVDLGAFMGLEAGTYLTEPDFIFEKTGLVTPPNSISLTTALQRMLGDVNFRTELSTNAVIHASNKFSIDSNLSSREKLYKSINESD